MNSRSQRNLFSKNSTFSFNGKLIKTIRDPSSKDILKKIAAKEEKKNLNLSPDVQKSKIIRKDSAEKPEQSPLVKRLTKKTSTNNQESQL